MGYFPLPLKLLFPLGRIVLSPAAESLGIDLMRFIRRHQTGDWGDLCDDDRAANQLALETNEAILSQYRVTSPTGVDETVSVMTESDRSMTILLLSDEPMESPMITDF